MGLFNKFIEKWDLQQISFDKQLTLYISFLSICDLALTTIATYISAVKGHKKLDGVQVQNDFLIAQMLKGVKNLNKGA